MVSNRINMMTGWIRRSAVGVLAIAFVVLCVGRAAAAAAQEPSLVELAKQEQARRKAVKAPSKVYTEKDLKRDGPGAPAAAGTPTPSKPDASVVPDASRPAAAATPVDTSGQHGEAWWKARMDQAREDLRRNEAFGEALQSRVNALTGDYVNRDDPSQRAKIGEDRQRAIAELDRVAREAEQAKKTIATIEEEARLAGVPPGWIR
jgi:hypothetical protein